MRRFFFLLVALVVVTITLPGSVYAGGGVPIHVHNLPYNWEGGVHCGKAFNGYASGASSKGDKNWFQFQLLIGKIKGGGLVLTCLPKNKQSTVESGMYLWTNGDWRGPYDEVKGNGAKLILMCSNSQTLTILSRQDKTDLSLGCTGN